MPNIFLGLIKVILVTVVTEIMKEAVKQAKK